MTIRDELTPEARAEWDEFVKHFRESTFKSMLGSKAMICIVIEDEDGHIDLDFAMQVGVSVLLDKPFIALISPGQILNPKLASIADAVIEGDVDTEAGQIDFRAKLMAAMHELGLADQS